MIQLLNQTKMTFYLKDEDGKITRHSAKDKEDQFVKTLALVTKGKPYKLIERHATGFTVEFK